MRTLFVEHDHVYEDKIILDGSSFNHVKNVYRMKIGDNINLTTGDNIDYKCMISTIENDRIICKIIEKSERHTELPIKVTLYQGLPKSDKMDLIVQKAVELGAIRIVPVSMKRSIVKLDSKKAVQKCKRWNEIALNAAEQSKRSARPEVSDVLTFKEAIKEAEGLDYILLPYETANGMDYTRKIFTDIKPSSSVGVFIGPEGGFDPDEIDMAEESGALIVTLGKRILRTETAGMTVLSVLSFIFEE